MQICGKLDRAAFRRVLLGAVAAACGAGVAAWAAPASAQVPANEKVPDLASIRFAWRPTGSEGFNGHWLDPPPGYGRGPIRQDPALPFHGGGDGPGQVTPDIGNTKDQVLKPWAAAQMQESNEEVLSGRRGLPFDAELTCHPGGVPRQLLTWPSLYFIQAPKEVWMIWQYDHMVRRVYLTDKHSEVVRPSWFGESIGHYEGGDTLVVDTIGLSTRNSFLDNYRTPHSENEHVIERFKLARDGNSSKRW